MAVSLSDSPPSQGPSCPVCFRDYSDNETNLIPRILLCGHTYCTECLDRLLNMEPNEDEYQQVVLNIRYAGREWTTTRNYPRSPYTSNELKCPTCKTINHIQNRDISSLTKNFALLGCRPQAGGTQHRNKHFCVDHDHEKRIYCSDCKTLICAYCQLYGGHRGHHYVVATEASKPSVESLKAADSTLSEDLLNLTSGEGSLHRTIARLGKTRNRSEKSVKRYFGDAISKLEAQRDSLLSQIASWTDEQMYILKAQLDMVTNSVKELKAVQCSCQSLIAGDPLDALTQQQDLEADVERLRDRLSDISLQPLIKPWMTAKEDGPCDEALDALVGNFKLSYDADTAVGGAGERDVGAAVGGEDQSGNESESSFDSLMGESGGRLSDVLEVYRLSNRRRGEDETVEVSNSRVYSQETQAAVGGNFAPMDSSAVRLQRAEGRDLNWVPSSGVSLFDHHRSMTHAARSSLHQLLDDDSGSNSDTENMSDVSGYARRYRPASDTRQRRQNDVAAGDSDSEQRRRRGRGRIESSSEESDHELEDILERHQDRTSAVGGTGVESVLDSLEIRRHWNFLNGGDRRDHMGAGAGNPVGEEAREVGEEEEEEEDPANMSLHTMVPMFPEGRSAHNTDSSPSPPPPHRPNLSDFAFPHHLSLPVDSGRDPDDEVVFPSTPHYSWTEQIEGRGRALQLNIGTSGMLQLSIQPNAGSDREDGMSDDDDDDGINLASEL